MLNKLYDLIKKKNSIKAIYLVLKIIEELLSLLKIENFKNGIKDRDKAVNIIIEILEKQKLPENE